MEILIEYLLISMAITFVILYMFAPKPKVILKYPSIKDDVSDLYVDENNVCYRYHKKQIIGNDGSRAYKTPSPIVEGLACRKNFTLTPRRRWMAC